MSRNCRLVIFGLLILLAGCGGKQHGVQAYLDDQYPEKLSAWQLFTGRQTDLKPNQGVIPYEVNTPLFSNYAAKFRTVWMPAGVSGDYRGDGVFNLPVGTILSKTFSFGDRRIETRLYVHKQNGWSGVAYVWNQQQTDAVLDVTPRLVPVRWNGLDFDYDIPNVNQCKVCHEGPNDNGPLGITARNLNHGDQLQQWVRAGYLKGVPLDVPRLAIDLETRAREYLDVNCGSCHVVGGRGMKSGLFLTRGEVNDRNLGVCKSVTDSPRSIDIVPGQPERSVMIERMLSLNPKVMMPDIGHAVVDREGVELIRQWIAAMKEGCPSI